MTRFRWWWWVVNLMMVSRFRGWCMVCLVVMVGVGGLQRSNHNLHSLQRTEHLLLSLSHHLTLYPLGNKFSQTRHISILKLAEFLPSPQLLLSDFLECKDYM